MYGNLAPRNGFSGLFGRTRSLLRRNVLSNHTSSQVTLRLLSTLVVLEQRGGQLENGYLNVISAARKIGGSIHGFIAGADVEKAAKDAARVQGIDRILTINNARYDKGLPENYAALVTANIREGQYTHVVAGHTAFGKSLMPRVAALLDSQQVSDVISIENGDTFIRPIYAGNAIATVQSIDPIKIITIRGTSFQPAETNDGSAEISAGVDPNAEAGTEWIKEELTKSDRPDLGTATKVVAGGRGLKSKENFDKIMLPLAEALGAAVGASRAAVDDGYADNSLQVGQTGKVVAPQLYLAVGISGAIQHLAGMKDSKVIAAINKNPDEPIFQVADVGLVGDLFEKVPELTKKLNDNK
jgi:electron transfer flavoprotein alpha subunit